MRKIVSILLCLIIVFCVSACADKKEVEVQTLSSAEEVSELLNVAFAVPATAKYCAFTITDNIVGQAHFTFNGFVFDMYASKLLSGTDLHQNKADYSGAVSLDFDDRADISINSYSDGSRVCEWTKDGTNYAIYCQKSANDDVFTELCDVIIK